MTRAMRAKCLACVIGWACAFMAVPVWAADAPSPAPSTATATATAAATAAATASPPAPAVKPLALNAIGRLFLTPAQRERAALVRRQDVPEPPTPAPTTGAPSPTVAIAPQPPAVYTVQGIVMRSDGTASLWLNGQRLDIPPGQAVRVDDVEIRLKSAAEAQIYVRELRRATAAPVGQLVSPAATPAQGAASGARP